MEKLIILDYSNASVHIYDIDRDANIDEERIEALGFSTNSIEWMFGEDIEIIHHKGVLV